MICALMLGRDGSTGSTLDGWNVSADCITEHDLRFGEVYRGYYDNQFFPPVAR